MVLCQGVSALQLWAWGSDSSGLVPGQGSSIPTASLCFLLQGTEVVTGEAAQGNYFRLHLSSYNTVDGITCLCKEPLPVSNIVCLYGQHERLLNDLCYRRGAGHVPDLYR